MCSASWWKKFYLKSPEKNKPALKILGIDPGSIKCGYGLVGLQGRDPFYISSGTISVPSSKPLQERLKRIFDALQEIIRECRPDGVVVEKIFFAKGAKAALSLGHARGIVLLAAASEGISLHECSALEVKKSVVGYGRAEKQQVMEMVRMILNVREPLYPDSADALALALCYANTIKFTEAVRKSE
jgi:crossover junction endodeoxyribonuclease RuvC